MATGRDDPQWRSYLTGNIVPEADNVGDKTVDFANQVDISVPNAPVVVPFPEEEEAAQSVEEVTARVAEMFPRVKTAWVTERAAACWPLIAIVDAITDPNINVPMKKRKENGNVNYFTRNLSYQMDPGSRLGAERALVERFGQISLPSIRAVLKAFGFNFAPAYKALHDEFSLDSFKTQKGPLIITSKPLGLEREELARRANWTRTAGVASLRLLKRPRRRALALQTLDEELATEIAWAEAALPPLIELANTTAPTGDGVGVECEVCCEEKVASAFASCQDGHEYCIDCVKAGATEAVFGLGRSEVACLEPGCKAGYAEGLLRQLLSASARTAMEERTGAAEVAAAGLEGFTKCLYCAWGAVIDTKPEEDKVFNCGGCGAATCRLCERDWDDEHIGRKCAELETDGATAARKRLEEDLSKAVLRACHKCGLQFQKVEGCNKMTCACKATSCYLCRKPDIHYIHFCQHPREPGQGCTVCTRCSLFEDARRVDSARLKAVADEADDADNPLLQHLDDVPKADPTAALAPQPQLNANFFGVFANAIPMPPPRDEDVPDMAILYDMAE